jgi:hypothetical protein
MQQASAKRPGLAVCCADILLAKAAACPRSEGHNGPLTLRVLTLIPRSLPAVEHRPLQANLAYPKKPSNPPGMKPVRDA